MPDDDPTRPTRDDPAGADGEPSQPADPDSSGVTDRGRRERREPRRRRTPLWLETLILLATALVLALLIKTFLVQAFYIPSASMEPGLVKNDRILVQKVSHWLGSTPSRGDVVVFEDPGGWLVGPEPGPETALAEVLAVIGLYPTGGHLVKRVVGLPGDTIVCCDAQGRLEINGTAVEADGFIRPQPDCNGPMVNGCRSDWRVTVPDDRLFVMGDNRSASADSSDRLCRPRRQGCDPDRAFVPVDLVVGQVFAIVWPFDHARFIGTPQAYDAVPDA